MHERERSCCRHSCFLGAALAHDCPYTRFSFVLALCFTRVLSVSSGASAFQTLLHVIPDATAAADIRLGNMTAAIQADVRAIYRKSLSKTVPPPASRMPDMLSVPQSQGGDLPDV